VAADFLRRQQLVVIGAATPDGAMWAGALTGPPGFVAAPDEQTVVARRTPVPGDPLADVFATEHDIGMLAIEPASRRRMRVNGRARQVDELLVVRTEQVYANCPKYIQARDVEAHVAIDPGDAVQSDRLSPGQQAWIGAADTFFVATHAPGLGADASHRGGGPGFVTVTGERNLSWPDYLGNSMYMTRGAAVPRLGAGPVPPAHRARVGRMGPGARRSRAGCPTPRRLRGRAGRTDRRCRTAALDAARVLQVQPRMIMWAPPRSASPAPAAAPRTPAAGARSRFGTTRS
jgi:predicted pyridoxine 5'-phosphate oxidase superfamily flavin-nucleotide-binding protein